MSIFDTVAFPKHKRNVFDLSHETRTSASFGKLIPVLCEEVLPGDTWQLDTHIFVRAMPMMAPLMHRVNIYTHFFFVPNRLVWDEWEDFITGGPDGTLNPAFPTYRLTSPSTYGPNSLADHLGCGIPNAGAGPSQNPYMVNALPFRAYQLIYNEYYRDQNLQDEIEIDKSSGLNTSATSVEMLELRKRCWEKDYFTSALPWTQRGPEATLPIGGRADVSLDLGAISPQNLGQRLVSQTFAPVNGIPGQQDGTLRKLQNPDGTPADVPYQQVFLDPGNTLYADLANASAAPINALRRAIALQRFLETNARGGARYIEQIFSHFGVVSSNASLQRPQYLGGGRQPLSISEVIQTSQTTNDSDLGDMAGHGISASKSNQFRRYFEEHGFIIGIMSIIPRSSYCDGTRRFMHKFDRFDYAWPEFANLGEQPIWNSEIFQTGQYTAGEGLSPEGESSGTFGYQSRYCEYKYIPNFVHGDLKTEAFNPWTLVRKFDSKPNLNGFFVEVDNLEDDLGRIFPITDSDTQFIVQMHHNIKAVRILPKHVIPSI